MSKFFNLTFATAFIAASAFAAPAAFAQDQAADANETAAVQAALNKDITLRLAHVRAETIDGVVYLQGTVDSPAAADRAEALAHSVPNVAKIVDALGDNAES